MKNMSQEEFNKTQWKNHGKITYNINLFGRHFVTGCGLLALSLLISSSMMCRAILKASGRYTPLWSDQNVITQQEYDAAQRESGLK